MTPGTLEFGKFLLDNFDKWHNSALGGKVPASEYCGKCLSKFEGTEWKCKECGEERPATVATQSSEEKPAKLVVKVATAPNDLTLFGTNVYSVLMMHGGGYGFLRKNGTPVLKSDRQALEWIRDAINEKAAREGLDPA